ncbi:hypothetical protein PIB30_082081 [Stylosanthes scabra]|uniref:Putative plant transposon protein domain-containing protein n=1 Tax=Stylosanthes scabra TaxID=79078 RepID=A0ABU6XTP4_9FABA|nr:hypothetical protein [Stylosanthes scabra]
MHMHGSTFPPFTLHTPNIHPRLGIPAMPRRALHIHTPHTPTYNPATAQYPSPFTLRRATHTHTHLNPPATTIHLRLGVPFIHQILPSPKSPITPRICVPYYAYAWEPTPQYHPSALQVFDNDRFKTAFNEELYNTIVKNKKVIAECCVDLDDDEYPEVQEEMEEHGGHTYRSFVGGVPIDFSPENIRTVMRFRAQVQGATTDFETRKEHDQQLDRVLADLCMPGATWKLSTGQQRVPIQLRRQELNPIARGWHEFSIHSLIPSSNRSEIPVIRAILIHCIMRGEDVRAEDIIADKMVRMAQGIKEKGKLGFPSTIYKLCKEAGVPRV